MSQVLAIICDLAYGPATFGAATIFDPA